MENLKLEKAFRELRSRSLSLGFPVKFKVVGNSMKPLISDVDEVEVFKIEKSGISIGDIIAWNKDTRLESIPVIHRVIAKKEMPGVTFSAQRVTIP